MQLLSYRGKAALPDRVADTVVRFDPESGLIVSVEPSDRPVPEHTYIFPGFIDIHVHARQYALPDDCDKDARAKWRSALLKELFVTAGEAAINGGVTSICAMPNDPLPPDTPDRYALKQSLAAASPCPMICYAAITADSEPWADLPYKLYLDYSPSSVSFTHWQEVEGVLSRYRGRRVFFHAEDPELLRQSKSLGPRWRCRPGEAETRAVERILEITSKLGLRTHICHVSTRKTVELILDYNRNASTRVTCEVTPHHLAFSISDKGLSSALGGSLPHWRLVECNPPIRTEADRVYMIDALKNGAVDALGSDHAPHTLSDKDSGAPGMPHLDTLAPFAGWLMVEHGFSPERIAEILSVAPSRLFAQELNGIYGKIEPAAVASLTVLDLALDTEVTVRGIENRGPLKTRCGWSPFSGVRLPAWTRSTIVNGRVYPLGEHLDAPR